MNSLVLTGIVFFFFLVAYCFYGRKLESLWDISPEKKTPAVEHPDGVDFIPAKHWTILFGHHFSSIAGAAPFWDL